MTICKERVRNAETLAIQRIGRRIIVWKVVNGFRIALTWCFGILAIVCFVGWLYSIAPIEKLVVRVVPPKFLNNVDGQVNFLTVIVWGFLSAIGRGLKSRIENMYSDSRKERLIKREKDRILESLNKESESDAAA